MRYNYKKNGEVFLRSTEISACKHVYRVKHYFVVVVVVFVLTATKVTTNKIVLAYNSFTNIRLEFHSDRIYKLTDSQSDTKTIAS